MKPVKISGPLKIGDVFRKARNKPPQTDEQKRESVKILKKLGWSDTSARYAIYGKENKGS